MSHVQRRRAPAAIAAALLLALCLPAAPGMAAVPVLLTVDSPPLTMTLRDMMEPGPSLGDLRVFTAPAVASDGRTGTRWFTSITTDMMAGDDVTEDRIGLLVLDLGNGDTIVIGGVSVVVEEGKAIPAGTPLARPILGGTGAYAGIRGEAVTVRTDDGAYRDELTILGLGDPLDAEPLRYTTAGGSRTDMDMDASGDAGMGLGDIRVVELPFRDAAGAEGISLGVHVRVGSPDDGSDLHTLIGMLVNDFGDGDRIYAAGVVRNGIDGLPPVGSDNARAIIGGSGRFAGARGVLTSTHVADGVVDYVARLATVGVPRPDAAGDAWSSTSGPGGPVDLTMSGDAAALADVRVWSDPVTGEDGTAGTSDGLLFTVDMESAEDPGHDRLGLWFDRYADGSQIAVAWSQVYGGPDMPMDADVASVGVIVGGTGRFAGVSGVVEVVRDADGGYTRRFLFAE